jgi:gamma-glutamylputrescine oxidase
VTLPLWLDEPYEPRPPLAGDAEADACVIGAGAAGLSCARALAEAGLDTIVLEAGTVAGGASGRNGGFLLAGLARFHPNAREAYGPETARALYRLTLDVQQEIYELGAAEAVRRTGSLRVAVSDEEDEHVRRQVAALREDGFPAELVSPEELPPLLRRVGRAGCLTEHDGTLHPARWVRALAEDAERRGARIHERTPVQAPVSGSPVRTPHGSVHAEHVFVAADGALPRLVPDLAGRVRARRLHMVGTEPVPERLLDKTAYLRWGYEYLQQLPDGRFALGGFSDLDGEASYTDDPEGNPAVWDRIERWAREELGIEAAVTHRWTGAVGYSDDLLPYAGQVGEGLYACGGYSGHGNVLAFACGRALAALATGGDAGSIAAFAPGR